MTVKLKPRVLVTTKLPGQMEKLFGDDFEVVLTEEGNLSREELLRHACDKDAIVSDLVNMIDKDFFDKCPKIKVVANVAVGYDNIDVSEASKRNILACNTPGVLTETTADLAFALLLAAARRIPESEKYLREGHWKSFALDLLLGVDVHHKTVGIIGFGRIGQAFASRAAGFNMRILYTQNKRAEAEIENKYGAQFVPMEELLQNSDFVSLHCPLNNHTRNLIAADQLAMMKRAAFLINTARGAIIDQVALIKALQNKQIAGAGLDVFSNEPEIPTPLLSMDNVVLLPHIGSASIETRSEVARLAVEAVRTAFNKSLPQNAINKDCWDGFLQQLNH